MTNTPTPRPDVSDIRQRLLDVCVGKPAKIPWPHRLLHDAADHIKALEERQVKLEAVVAKETPVIRNFMARINPTKLAAADDQQYVVAIHAIDNLEALTGLDGGGNG